jgi:hypothetical protein
VSSVELIVRFPNVVATETVTRAVVNAFRVRGYQPVPLRDMGTTSLVLLASEEAGFQTRTTVQLKYGWNTDDRKVLVSILVKAEPS